jgi:hypothetical protein
MNQQAAAMANSISSITSTPFEIYNPSILTSTGIGMGAQGIQAGQAPKKPDGSFSITLEKIEDGYVVHVSQGTPYDNNLRTSKRYIAAELDEALDKAKAGIVTFALEK